MTALKAGTATITVTTTDGSKTATCKVTVKEKVAVTGVTLAKTTATVYVGETLSLKATVAPSDATDQTVTWKSSNKAVAKVSSKGVVTALKAGTATITVTTKDGSKTATCTVTVINPTIAVVSISLDKTTLDLLQGSTYALTATITPADATNKEIAWSSSDTSIATVENGKVTAVSSGSATITATTKDGGIKATCNVNVTAASETSVEDFKDDKIEW